MFRSKRLKEWMFRLPEICGTYQDTTECLLRAVSAHPIQETLGNLPTQAHLVVEVETGGLAIRRRNAIVSEFQGLCGAVLNCFTPGGGRIPEVTGHISFARSESLPGPVTSRPFLWLNSTLPLLGDLTTTGSFSLDHACNCHEILHVMLYHGM